MDLTGCVIHTDRAVIPVQRGLIRTFHFDRRGTATPSSTVDHPLRRRPAPPEVRPLVGTGRLGVAHGAFEVRAVHTSAHTPGASLVLEVREVRFVICHLGNARASTQIQRWDFVALFEPDERMRGWLQRLTGHSVPAAVPSTKRALPLPPVFHQHVEDEQLIFLRELAELDAER
jgi:hypothetical protein